MATQPQTSDWQRKLFRVLPLFIVAGLFFYPNIPAGLVLYWMTTNLWTCGQQVVLKRRLGPLNLVTTPLAMDEPVEAPPAKAAKPAQARPATTSTEATARAEGNGSPGTTQKKPRPKGGAQSQRRRPPKKR